MQAQLGRMRDAEDTKAVARASMSPLRASLVTPLSALRSARAPRRGLDDQEAQVLSKSLDSVLLLNQHHNHPLTRAAAKLGTYGDRWDDGRAKVQRFAWGRVAVTGGARERMPAAGPGRSGLHACHWPS